MTVDHFGRFVYVLHTVAAFTDGVSAFTINTTTGELTSIGDPVTVEDTLAYITTNRRGQ